MNTLSLHGFPSSFCHRHFHLWSALDLAHPVTIIKCIVTKPPASTSRTSTLFSQSYNYNYIQTCCCDYCVTAGHIRKHQQRQWLTQHRTLWYSLTQWFQSHRHTMVCRKWPMHMWKCTAVQSNTYALHTHTAHEYTKCEDEKVICCRPPTL